MPKRKLWFSSARKAALKDSLSESILHSARPGAQFVAGDSSQALLLVMAAIQGSINVASSVHRASKRDQEKIQKYVYDLIDANDDPRKVIEFFRDEPTLKDLELALDINIDRRRLEDSLKKISF